MLSVAQGASSGIQRLVNKLVIPNRMLNWDKREGNYKMWRSVSRYKEVKFSKLEKALFQFLIRQITVWVIKKLKVINSGRIWCQWTRGLTCVQTHETKHSLVGLDLFKLHLACQDLDNPMISIPLEKKKQSMTVAWLRSSTRAKIYVKYSWCVIWIT